MTYEILYHELNKIFGLKPKVIDDCVNIMLFERPYKKQIHNGLGLCNIGLNHGYKNFDLGNIALLTKDWCTITPSIETVFKLMFNVNAYKIIAFLIDNEITPEFFSEFLYEYYRILFINYFDYDKNSLYKRNLIINIPDNSSILFLGEESCNVNIKKKCRNWAKFIHPSDNNWSNINYYHNWINKVKFEFYGDFNINNFIIVK